MHKIAFPPTHPKYSHLFYPEWINRTRESFFKFLIPFLKDNQYPSLCNIISTAQGKSGEGEPSVSPSALNHIKDQQKQTTKLAKKIYESASDFVDMIAESGGAVDSDILDEFQRKLNEMGKALFPTSPGGTNLVSAADSMASIESVDTTGTKKKKKHRKKHKPRYDYKLIGVDLSSMMTELCAELAKHLQEGRIGGTSSMSVDLEMATQSAFQGCLLIKALRHVISSEQKHDASPSSKEAIPENGSPVDPPSPRSKGGCVDKVVLSMTQGDLLGVTSSNGQEAGEDGVVVETTALPFDSLLGVYKKSVEYFRNIPVVEDPEDGQSVSREDQMLTDTLRVSRYFIEDYISLIAHVCTSESGVQYLADNTPGSKLYSSVIELLLELRPDKEDMMVKLHVVCLCTMITIGNKISSCLLTFIEKGGIPWLFSTLDRLTSLNAEVASNLPDHENYSDLCMGLLHLIVREKSCRAQLFESADMITSATSLAFLLIGQIMVHTEKLKTGKRNTRSSETPPEDILFCLLEEKEIRNAIRESSELNSLKELVKVIEEEKNCTEKISSIKAVLKTIDSAQNIDVEPSVSDLVYSTGVRNLVSDMLGSLQDSDDVLKYREENQAYSTNIIVLEKYKQDLTFSPS